jgi:hypothetical protein
VNSDHRPNVFEPGHVTEDQIEVACEIYWNAIARETGAPDPRAMPFWNEGLSHDKDSMRQKMRFALEAAWHR